MPPQFYQKLPLAPAPPERPPPKSVSVGLAAGAGICGWKAAEAVPATAKIRRLLGS